MLNFLINYGFSIEEINKLELDIPAIIIKKFILNKNNFLDNLVYLREIGIINYKEVFVTYYDIFLLDNKKFVAIFSKYEKEELIEFVKNDITVIEFL